MDKAIPFKTTDGIGVITVKTIVNTKDSIIDETPITNGTHKGKMKNPAINNIA